MRQKFLFAVGAAIVFIIVYISLLLGRIMALEAENDKLRLPRKR